MTEARLQCCHHCCYMRWDSGQRGALGEREEEGQGAVAITLQKVAEWLEEDN